MARRWKRISLVGVTIRKALANGRIIQLFQATIKDKTPYMIEKDVWQRCCFIEVCPGQKYLSALMTMD